jgi:hypothetical protein
MRIAFTGLAGCGKSLAAGYLVGNYGFTRLSFAAKLKEYVQNILNRPINKKIDRAVLQEFGVLMRKYNPTVWITLLDMALAKLPSCTNIVIDDLRFLNEHVFLVSKGFYIVKISGRERKMSEKLKAHASEQDIKLIQSDDHIHNSYGFRELFEQIEECLDRCSIKSDDIMFDEMFNRGNNR